MEALTMVQAQWLVASLFVLSVALAAVALQYHEALCEARQRLEQAEADAERWQAHEAARRDVHVADALARAEQEQADALARAERNLAHLVNEAVRDDEAAA